MRRLVLFLFACLLLSCNSERALLPNVSGKAGEIVVVMDKGNWEGELGNAVRELLGSDCPYLAQKEPMYNLFNVTHNGFAEMLQVHRNVLMFNIDASSQEEQGMIHRSDVWARPQCVLQISAPSKDSALVVLHKNSELILGTIEQAERDRIINNSIRYEEPGLAPVVKQMVGGSPHFPMGYSLKKATEDFIWIADEKQYTNQGIFIYKYPASEVDNFSVETIIAHRNNILQANVPGMFDDTWMTTATYVTPTVEYIRFRGRQFAQTRGFWEVHGDFMGGPFVSHAFYSKDGREIIVLDAWVYAPKYDKRHYLRQVEAIIYSFEWNKNEGGGKK